jgi:hypothetical protein
VLLAVWIDMNTTQETASPATPRLTSLSHGGGCGCKIAPGVLSELLAKSNLPKQFFPDLLEFVRHAVDTDKKHCVVVGLDGDAERRPFGQVLDLIPHCDRVTKMTAMCKLCADGTPALFTFAAGAQAAAANAEGVPCVGTDDIYIPLCRKHYLSARFPASSPHSIPCRDTHANLIGRI